MFPSMPMIVTLIVQASILSPATPANQQLEPGSVVSSDLLSISLDNLSMDNGTGFISRFIPSMAICFSPFEFSSGAFSFVRVGGERLNGENISKQNAD